MSLHPSALRVSFRPLTKLRPILIRDWRYRSAALKDLSVFYNWYIFWECLWSSGIPKSGFHIVLFYAWYAEPIPTKEVLTGQDRVDAQNNINQYCHLSLSTVALVCVRNDTFIVIWIKLLTSMTCGTWKWL